jgi:hypothetical protein
MLYVVSLRKSIIGIPANKGDNSIVKSIIEAAAVTTTADDTVTD